MSDEKKCPRCKEKPATHSMYCRPCAVLVYLDVRPVVYGERKEEKRG